MKKLGAALLIWLIAPVLPALSGAAQPRRMVLENKIVLLAAERRALPMVSIEMLLDAGARHDPAGRAGVANLVARLLTYGTRRRTAVEIGESLDFIGANLSASCGVDLATVSLTLLKKDLGAGLQLLGDLLTGAAFPDAEIERQKQAVLAAIRAREEDPGDIAERRFAAALFPNSVYGRPVEGDAASIRSVNRNDLRKFFEEFYRPNRAIVSVVGDVSAEEVADALDRTLRAWAPGGPRSDPVPARAALPSLVRVEKDLSQANIVLGHEGVPRSHPDYYAIQVMNTILGGGNVSSRVMDSIRNERGLAYSVYTHFAAEKSHGSFQFVMQTKSESAREAIRIARAELERMRREPVSEQELRDAKDYLMGSFPLRLDTNRKVANFLAQAEYFQLGLDYPERYPELVRKVGRQDVLNAARRYLQPAKLITVIVGDQKQIGYRD